MTSFSDGGRCLPRESQEDVQICLVVTRQADIRAASKASRESEHDVPSALAQIRKSNTGEKLGCHDALFRKCCGRSHRFDKLL